MAWSYSGDPSSSPLDAVRFEIGDTDESDALLQNEEIMYVLDEEMDSVLRAALRCCENIIARFSREVNKKIGPTSINASEAVQHYQQLADNIRRRLQIKAMIYCGSLSLSEEEKDTRNKDLKKPIFKRNIMSHQ